jgi:hypothetical protein
MKRDLWGRGKGKTHINAQHILCGVCLSLLGTLKVYHETTTAILTEFVGFGLGVKGVGPKIFKAYRIIYFRKYNQTQKGGLLTCVKYNVTTTRVN